MPVSRVSNLSIRKMSPYLFVKENSFQKMLRQAESKPPSREFHGLPLKPNIDNSKRNELESCLDTATVSVCKKGRHLKSASMEHRRVNKTSFLV
jgi:hypothetical protein